MTDKQLALIALIFCSGLLLVFGLMALHSSNGTVSAQIITGILSGFSGSLSAIGVLLRTDRNDPPSPPDPKPPVI